MKVKELRQFIFLAIYRCIFTGKLIETLETQYAGNDLRCLS